MGSWTVRCEFLYGVFASSVFQGCVLEIFGVSFSINLIPIPMGDVCVIYGEGTRLGLGFCSATRDRQYIQHWCAGYLAYVVDTQVGDQVSVSNVPVVREFPHVFLEGLPGFPPERKGEFRINIVPGATPIANSSYGLAPPGMQELSYQLKELLGKQFIRPSSSL
ncbi:uncharacterized protein LOC111913879 [Lactuca sativa]|uniref:uncharacterized protein LOC111913879 n=1 Tax=Lactuca sativa TaxID=4236 RepID=UPI000CD7F349|nr:uncharacterized protein LOC111913879 [Lactuca sativa]